MSSERAERILDVFEERAAADGVRAVVMGELARDLHMSTKTLYREYQSKDVLVCAVMERWARRFQEAVRASGDDDTLPVVERLKVGTSLRHEWHTRYAARFWDDIREDHPDAWNRYLEALAMHGRRLRSDLARALRPGVAPLMVEPLLRAMTACAEDPETLAATGMSAEDSLDAAIDVWARGVLA